MKTLIEFGQNPEVTLKTLEEKKYKTFVKSFKKDLYAITDMIIYFKRVQTQNLRTITTTRKKYFVNMKKEQLENLEEEKNYCLLAEKLFCHNQDRYLLEFLKMAIYSHEGSDVDKMIQDFKQATNSLQKELNEVDFQQDSKQFDEQDQNQEQQKQSNSNSVDLDELAEVKQIDSFPVNIREDYKSIALNKDKISEVDQTYQEIIYQSLLYGNKFQACYEKFQTLQKPIFKIVMWRYLIFSILLDNIQKIHGKRNQKLFLKRWTKSLISLKQQRMIALTISILLSYFKL